MQPSVKLDLLRIEVDNGSQRRKIEGVANDGGGPEHPSSSAMESVYPGHDEALDPIWNLQSCHLFRQPEGGSAQHLVQRTRLTQDAGYLLEEERAAPGLGQDRLRYLGGKFGLVQYPASELDSGILRQFA